MDEDRKSPRPAVEKKAAAGRDEREARLTAALRDNLRRRKGAPPKPAKPTSGGKR